MDAGVKNKIIIFFYLICFGEIHLIFLQDLCVSAQKSEITQIKFRNHKLKNIVKRNADWSKRLHSSLDIETPAQIAEESENIEVTSKLPRVVRRMKMHQGEQQHIETLKHMNPESRYFEGGTKVVRVKKFKVKQVRKTTIAPVTTMRVFTPKPETVNSGGTSSSPYSHITVINKEIRNPKKKKNKKKRINEQYVPTSAYFPEPKQNGRIFVKSSPDMPQISASKHISNVPNFHPNYERINYENQESVISNSQNFQNMQDILTNKQNVPSVREIPNEFEYQMSQVKQPILNSRNVNYSVRKSISMKKPKNSEYVPNFTIYSQDDSQQLTASESRHESVKNVSKETEEDKNDVDVKTKAPSSTEDKSILQATILSTEASPSTIATIIEQQSVSKKENIDAPSVRVSNIGSVLHPNEPTTLIKPEQYIFPSRFPSLLQNQKDLFSDPFFHNPEIHSPLHSSSQGSPYQFMSPMNLDFSPFYKPADPHNEEHSIYPYHSNPSTVHGFHQSPHITSLRRSIIDTYEYDTTTAEPVTHFSLPKFEIPQIDFSDKGCQTVYKEVKTLPARDPKTARNDEKSFVLTRECYFPNGLPTTKPQKEIEVTTTPSTVEISNEKSEDLKNNAK